MTLPEELRQASRYTTLDHHRDLLERAAAAIEADQKDAARFQALAGNPYFDGYAWWLMDVCVLDSKAHEPPTLEQTRAAIDAALSTQEEKPTPEA